jgi:flavin reductase (DIM6/NTAB) family NADH-FMN oxidoreductase RutF/DNA-binding GntR family transcriptional regulator
VEARAATAASVAPVGRSQLDEHAFRDVIGRFASGVTVVTTRMEDRDFGTTASAVSSLSVEPPMLLVCLNKTSETQQAIVGSGRFAVNILGEHQEQIAYRFATKSPSKFQEGDIVRGDSRLPLIAHALAQLECRVAETVTGGTHTVFLAEVERASATEGAPLTYYRGRFGRFEDALQEAAYRQLRGLVLSRSLPLGKPLDADGLARELGLERPRVYYALTKLATDGLVVRDPDGAYVVKPLDARLAGQAIEARCLIETAVADAVVGRIDAARLAELRAYADAACASVTKDPVDYRGLSEAGRSFHETFVGLTENDLVVDVYRRLRIEGIWTRALRHQDGPHHLSPTYLRELVDACAAGDVDTAKRLVRDHAAEARESARAAIARAGGEV